AFVVAAPARKGIGQGLPIVDVHSRFAVNEAGIELRPDRTFVHVGADEYDLLATIAVEIVPVPLDLPAPLRLGPPSCDRHCRPPEPKSFRADDRAGLTQFAQPLRSRGDPEVSFGADDAGP